MYLQARVENQQGYFLQPNQLILKMPALYEKLQITYEESRSYLFYFRNLNLSAASI